MYTLKCSYLESVSPNTDFWNTINVTEMNYFLEMFNRQGFILSNCKLKSEQRIASGLEENWYIPI
jgi:hypothetical protein